MLRSYIGLLACSYALLSHFRFAGSTLTPNLAVMMASASFRFLGSNEGCKEKFISKFIKLINILLQKLLGWCTQMQGPCNHYLSMFKTSYFFCLCSHFLSWFRVYLFIWLCWVLVAVSGNFFFFLVAYAGSYLGHAGSSSLTRDRTRAPCIGSSES